MDEHRHHHSHGFQEVPLRIGLQIDLPTHFIIEHRHTLSDELRSALARIANELADSHNSLAELIGLAAEQTQKEIRTMSDTSDRLAREVGETRDAVTALTGRYQAKIDAMQVQIDELKAALANGDTQAATAAADALDALQTEMAALGQAPADTGNPSTGSPADSGSGSGGDTGAGTPPATGDTGPGTETGGVVGEPAGGSPTPPSDTGNAPGASAGAGDTSGASSGGTDASSGAPSGDAGSGVVGIDPAAGIDGGPVTDEPQP